MNILKYVILSSKDASLGEADHIFDTYEDAENEAKPGQAVVELVFELTDSILVTVIEE